MAQQWHLYILRCYDGQLYTGITTDVQRRLQQHSNGTGAKRLRGRDPLTLEYQHGMPNKSVALRIEYQIKQLSREQKEQLIAGQRELPQIPIGNELLDK